MLTIVKSLINSTEGCNSGFDNFIVVKGNCGDYFEIQYKAAHLLESTETYQYLRELINNGEVQTVYELIKLINGKVIDHCTEDKFIKCYTSEYEYGYMIEKVLIFLHD